MNVLGYWASYVDCGWIGLGIVVFVTVWAAVFGRTRLSHGGVKGPPTTPRPPVTPGGRPAPLLPPYAWWTRETQGPHPSYAVRCPCGFEYRGTRVPNYCPRCGNRFG